MTCPRPQKSLAQSGTRSWVSTSRRAPVPATAPYATRWSLLGGPKSPGIKPGSPGVADRTTQGGRGRMGAGSPLGAAHSLSDPYGGGCGGGGRCLRGGRARPPGGC